MAKILPKGKLKGVSGSIYFRMLNGEQILQTRPNRSKQNKDKNAYAVLFKHTAHSLKAMRKNIENFLGNRQDSKAHLRLTGEVMKALLRETTHPLKETTVYNTPLANLVGFDWNMNHTFNETFLAEIKTITTSQDKLQVAVTPFIPREQVDFPSGCTTASLRVGCFCLDDTDCVVSIPDQVKTIEFKFSEPIIDGVIWELTLPTKSCWTMVVAEVQFFYPINNNPNQLTLYNYKEYNPSKVVYVSNMQIGEQ